MNRRKFLGKLVGLFKGLILLRFLPLVFITKPAEASKENMKHFKPLNGVSLREIALKKEHHGDGIYLNPLGMPHQRGFSRLLRWKWFSKNHFKKYYSDEPVNPITIDWKPVRKHHGVSVTYIRHASIMVKDSDQYLIIDPVLFDLFWFIDDYSPISFDLKEMPHPDHVLVTHGHYDHLDTKSLALFGQETHMITPLGYHKVFKELGNKNRTQLDWYDTYRAGKIEITLLPCNHWTMRNPVTGPNRSLWGSYMIKTSDGRHIYVSGDTAYFDGFQDIGKEYDIDLAIFNLGAYEPRWFMAQSHINPAETVKALKELNAKKLMIVHWGTFRLGDEPVHFPPMEINRELKKEGLLDRLVDIKHGETYYL